MKTSLVLLAPLLLSALAHAQPYPNRAIRMIVPQAAGSASDTVARIVAGELTPLKIGRAHV